MLLERVGVASECGWGGGPSDVFFVCVCWGGFLSVCVCGGVDNDS